MKRSRDSFVVIPEAATFRAIRSAVIHWYGMDWIAMNTNPFHCEAFHRIGMVTNAMDTNGFASGELATVANGVTAVSWHAWSAPETGLNKATCARPFAAR